MNFSVRCFFYIMCALMMPAALVQQAAAQSELERQSTLALRTYRDLDQDDPVFKDIYVQLYMARMQRVQAMMGAERARLEQSRRELARADLLLARKVFTVQEHERHAELVQVAQFRVAGLEAQLLEAEAVLNIAIDRISLGLTMPICASTLPTN